MYTPQDLDSELKRLRSDESFLISKATRNVMSPVDEDASEAGSLWDADASKWH